MILVSAQELHTRIDDGTIPLGAVKALTVLAKIHPELPACALRRVVEEPVDSWRRRLSWADVTERSRPKSTRRATAAG